MKDIYTVSAVNQYIKQLVDSDYSLQRIYVRGEVSNCKYHSSGHIYFTLKDKGGAIACVMFSGQRLRGLKFKMTEGMQVIVLGSISVYERDGRNQLNAVQILQEGTGYLYEQYEKLKQKLLEEGLFDPSAKKDIPKFPEKIGIVTAPTGAAIQDMINSASRRNPYVQLVLYPARVQGEGASKTIVKGIQVLDDYGVDVIIVGRGGGSIEDLWAFNEESVARAIFACHTPVISAVGHETDTTIADYAADLRAPTPSAAAELAVPDVFALMSRIEENQIRMDRAMRRQIDLFRMKLSAGKNALLRLSPHQMLAQKRQYLMHMEERMTHLMALKMKETRYRLDMDIEKLNGLSPLAKLGSGYAFVANTQGMPMTSVNEAAEGDTLDIIFKDGRVCARVLSIDKTDDTRTFAEGGDCNGKGKKP